jgi:hypothetical protein
VFLCRQLARKDLTLAVLPHRDQGELTDTTAAPSGWLHPFHPSRDRRHTDTECFGCFSHAVQVVIDAQCSLSELDRVHVLGGRPFEAVTMPGGSVSNHPYTAVVLPPSDCLPAYILPCRSGPTIALPRGHLILLNPCCLLTR